RSSEQDDVIAAINDDSQETAENVFFADQTDDDVPENAENTIVNEVPLQEDINSQTSADVADSIQGIALADGERVLGYQGESIDDEPDNLVTPSVTQESGVDPELLARINNAIESLNDDPVVSNADPVTVRDTFLRVDQLSPLIQDQLPSLSFSAHFYASDPQSRFVRVNGRRLEEGDNITADLSIDEINADTVLLDFRGQRFTMKALTDWQ
ncbi:MAG: general secretion pathway protein GspB, partial [Pseudomonadota bacterium]